MIRSKTAKYINHLVNHPSIRPTCGGDGKSFIDFTLNFKNIISLECEGGAWLFFSEGDGVYECHYFFLPSRRGRKALDMGRKCLKYMFDVIGAIKLIGRAPIENRLTNFYNTALGGTKGVIEKVYIKELDWSYEAQIYTLTKEEWLKCHQ